MPSVEELAHAVEDLRWIGGDVKSLECAGVVAHPGEQIAVASCGQACGVGDEVAVEALGIRAHLELGGEAASGLERPLDDPLGSLIVAIAHRRTTLARSRGAGASARRCLDH